MLEALTVLTQFARVAVCALTVEVIQSRQAPAVVTTRVTIDRTRWSIVLGHVTTSDRTAHYVIN